MSLRQVIRRYTGTGSSPLADKAARFPVFSLDMDCAAHNFKERKICEANLQRFTHAEVAAATDELDPRREQFVGRTWLTVVSLIHTRVAFHGAQRTLDDDLAARHPQVRVIHHERNLGYGAALQSGFRAATKQLVFYTDGDGQFDMGEMPALLPLMDQYDIVSCYRIDRQDNLLRKTAGRLWTGLNRLVFSLNIRDIDCAFKLYKREIFDNIQMESAGALIDTEILARAARKGYRMTQRGVHHYPRTTGQQTGASPAVVLRAFRELLRLRGRILRNEP